MDTRPSGPDQRLSSSPPRFQLPCDHQLRNPGVIRVERGDADVVELSYDPPGRSVRCRWSRGSTMVMDLFREGATLLRAETQEDTARLVVDVATGSLAGEMLVQVQPAITVEDRLLLQ